MGMDERPRLEVLDVSHFARLNIRHDFKPLGQYLRRPLHDEIDQLVGREDDCLPRPVTSPVSSAAAAVAVVAAAAVHDVQSFDELSHGFGRGDDGSLKILDLDG